MRIIITGGTGLIGSALAASLAADNHQVISLTRTAGKMTALPQGVRAEKWDGRTANGWGKLADGADAIVNLAGESIASGRWTDERKRRIHDSRVNAGQAVTEAVKAATQKPAVVIQSSAVGYYGPHGDEELDESAPLGQDFLAQICKDWEASTAPVEAMGVRRAIVRTGVVLSKKGGALPQMLLPFKLFAGGPLGSGKQWLPWIHITDQVAAIRFLIENKNARGVFNLSAPNPLTNAEFGRVIGRVMGRPAFMPTPGLALKLVFGEMATLLLEGQRQMPKRLLELGFAFRFPSAEAALRDILK
jgi:uncharacterized protein (TIGR01777 family)